MYSAFLRKQEDGATDHSSNGVNGAAEEEEMAGNFVLLRDCG